MGLEQGRLRPLPRFASGGAARGMQLPFLPASVRPTSARPGAPGSARRPRPRARPRPAPRQPGNQAPRPLGPEPAAQACGWARGGGPGAPHTRPRSPSPVASRALGGARFPGPSAPRPGRPVRLPQSGPPPLPHHHPYRLVPPPPPGTSANGGSPGPGPTCTAQPSLEVGAGNLPPSSVSHWPFRGTS